MRFTKFLAATMAAMTIVSCSEQVEDFGANVQPGDAVLSFKVGTNGGTTYASSEDESKVNTLIGFLAYTDENGAAAFMEINGSAAGLNTTIPDGKYTAGPATMYFVANMPAVAGVANEAALTAFTDTKTIYTNVGGALTLDATGMSATRKVAISLKSGQVTEGTPEGGDPVTDGKIALKRLAARVYAVSGNTGASDITGYKVDFAGTKANSTLFGHVGGGAGIAPATYSITGTGTGQYGGFEAVGYVYPSADDVTITVTHKDGTLTKDVKFKPEANKNYKLIITPSTPGTPGTTPNFTVTVAAYDDGGNLDVDFANSTLPISSTATLPANFKVGTGGVLEITNAVGTPSASVKITLAELFKGTPQASLQVYRAVSTLALGANYKISADGMFAIGDTDSDGLNFVALANDGADKTYKATFELWDGTNESSVKSYVINVVRKSVNNLPANFTTTIDGVEFMSVNWQGSMEATKTLVTNIDKMVGADFAEKTLAFSKVSAANLALLTGAQYEGKELPGSLTTTAICPAGFTLPSQAQVTRLFKFTKFDGTEAAKPLTEGKNSFGDNTINYNVSYSTVEDKAGHRLFIPNKTNFATSIVVSTSGTQTVLRVVFWNSELQLRIASIAVRNTSVRCVKVPQTPLS